MTRATLIRKFKQVLDNGDIIELVIWAVPSPVQPAPHSFKYRAVYIVKGERVIGFDNERGKGDHMHIDGREVSYDFTSPEQLAEDFIEAIEIYRSKP